MGLFDISIVKKSEKPLSEEVVALIRRRRRQLIVHSCIYYELNTNLISDHTYDSWAKELANLHKQYGVVKINCYDEYFKDWIAGVASTYSGYQLPLRDPDIYSLALRLVSYAEYEKVQQNSGKKS